MGLERFAVRVPGAFGRDRRPSQEPMVPDESWRVEGVSEEYRFLSVGEAEVVRREVEGWKPRRSRGRGETGGRRPSLVTAERLCHSRGRAWDRFIESLGVTGLVLSRGELMGLFDGRKIGGLGVFGDWREGCFYDRRVVQRVIVFCFERGDFVCEVVEGGYRLVPWVDQASAVEWLRQERERLERNRGPRVWTTPGVGKPPLMSWREWFERGGRLKPSPVVHRERSSVRKSSGKRKASGKDQLGVGDLFE